MIDNTPLPGFSYWNEHPDYPIADWKYEVANGDTRTGYWEWIKKQTEGDS